MKKFLLLAIAALFFTGCSNTWQGVQEDSSKIWNETKEAVHKATE